MYTTKSDLVQEFKKRIRSTKAQIMKPYFAVSFKLIYSICRSLDNSTGNNSMCNRFHQLVDKAIYRISFYTPSGKHRLPEIDKMLVDFQGCCVAIDKDGKDEVLLCAPDNNRESMPLHIDSEDPLQLIVSTKEIREYLWHNWGKYPSLKILSEKIDSIEGGRTDISNGNVDDIVAQHDLVNTIDIKKIFEEVSDILDNSSFILLDSKQ